MASPPHRPAYIVPIIVSFIVMIAMFTMNGLAASDVRPVFVNSTGGISEVWYLNIVPSGSTFSIWGVIYAWQVIFMGYALSTICRRGVDDEWMYYSPCLIPPVVYVTYTLNNCLNITWLFLWDRTVENIDLLIAATVVLALVAFTLYICIAISARAVDRNYGLLQKAGLVREAWMVRFMVHNAFAFYATWTSIATLLNLGSCIAYRGPLDQDLASVIMLGILAFEIVVWFLLDTFVLDRYVRFIFAPYIVCIWALTGSVVKNYVPGERNAIFLVVLLAVSCAALVAKVILMTWRGIKRPLYSNSMSFVSPEEGKENPGYDMNEASGKNM